MAILKKEFADRMAENGGITKKAAFEVVDLFMETLIDYLSEDEKVMFSGFGRFEVRKAKEKIGRNFKTETSCIIPEREYVGFHASKSLMGMIEERRDEESYGTEE